MERVNVAVFLTNLVPYHCVRWGAFAQRFSGTTTVIQLRDFDPFHVLDANGASRCSVPYITLFHGEFFAAYSPKEVLRRTCDTLNRLRPSVVCINGYSSPLSLAVISWALRRAIPVVLCSESNSYDAPRKTLREWIKRRVVSLCTTGLAGGTPQARYLAELGMPQDRVFLGYDVVDNDHFQHGAALAREKAGAVRRSHGLPQNYFLACSRFTAKKNLAMLLRAYAAYCSCATVGRVAFEPWDLVIVGDGELGAELKADAARLGVPQVRFPGAKGYEELPVYYGLARAFIQGSLTEQWGLVVNEAMAAGLPILVSNRCGCAPDLVREGINGFTFDPFKPEELTALMLKVSNLNSQLSNMGRESRRIIGSWGPGRFASGFEAAVAKSVEVGSKRGTFPDRVFIATLMRATKFR